MRRMGRMRWCIHRSAGEQSVGRRDRLTAPHFVNIMQKRLDTFAISTIIGAIRSAIITSYHYTFKVFPATLSIHRELHTHPSGSLIRADRPAD